MGGTLPVLSKFFVRRLHAVGKDIAVLYGLNTLGACGVVIVSGFVLFPNMGIGSIVVLTALINIAVGIVSIVAAVCYRGSPADEEDAVFIGHSGVPRALFSERGRLLVLSFGLSGAVSMLYEIAWTRILAMLVGSSVYAFSMMLGTFLFGLVIGSALFKVLSDRIVIRLRTFGLLQMCIAGSVVACLPLIQQIPFLYLKIYKVAQGNMFFFQGGIFFICSLLMIVPTMCIGMTFPMVSQLYARNKEELGGDIGRVYAVNTVGNIIGSLIAGFLLVPWIGIHATLVAGSIVQCVIGLAVWLRDPSKKKNSVWFVAAVCVAVIFAGYRYPWPKVLLSSGIHLKAKKWMNRSRKSVQDSLKAISNLAFYRDGLNCTVSVSKTAHFTYLKVNGKTDASTMQTDMDTQILCGYVPMLFARDPRSVFVIGLGSGITASACADFPVERIDVAEIENAVVQASDFFRTQNKDVLRDRRVRVYPEDGRNYLLREQRSYDVIISEPSNPWIEGVSSLFTGEFYRLIEERLNPGGIVCQWLQIYSMDFKEVTRILKTFQSVFPYVSVWESNNSDLLLIGGKEPLKLSLQRLQEVYTRPAVMGRLKKLGFSDPLSLLSVFLFDQNMVAGIPGGEPLNTDDFNILEYAAPLSLYQDTIEDNRQSFSKHLSRRSAIVDSDEDKRTVDSMEARKSFVYTYLYRLDPARAEWEFDSLAQEFPDDIRHYFDLVLACGSKNKYTTSIGILKRLISEKEDARYYYYLGVLYERNSAYREAEGVLRRAIALSPVEVKPYLLLGRILREHGEYEAAISVLRSGLQYCPGNRSLLSAIRRCEREMGKKKENGR